MRAFEEKIMSRKLNAMPAVMVAFLAVVLIFTMAFTLTGNVATADETPTGIQLNEITVGHISDIHYFPVEYSYTKITADNYKSSAFYNSLTGDTKLVIESGNVLYAQVERYIADAKTGEAPLYLLATGDLTKNGERAAHVDVANALRYLQNQIRALADPSNPDYSTSTAKYKDFQIFATSGNHDLYNGSGALYSQVDGSGYKSECVTAAQFALIYAGLGYPDRTYTELCNIYPAAYWYGTFTGEYIESNNSTNVVYTYMNEHLDNIYDKFYPAGNIIGEYAQIGDDNNAISFAAKVKNTSYSFFIIDATDREATTSVVPAHVSKAEYDAMSNASDFTYYTFANNKYTEITGDVVAAFASGEVYRGVGLSHLTGGRIISSTFNFLENYISSDVSGDSISECTYVAAFHQNLVPHFEQEDDILKDFVLYNWEYTAKRFAELGIRLSLTGHQHSSDVAYYTDSLGRTVYDMQNGSMVSVDSAVRYITIDRYSVGGKLAEKIDSSSHLLDAVGQTPLKETPTTNVFSAAAWNETAYQSAIGEYNANPTDAKWTAVLNANPDYYIYTILHKELSTMSFNEYIYEEIYGQLLDRLLDHFLNDSLYNTVMGLVDSYLAPDNSILASDSLLNGALGKYSDVVYKMAKYIVNVVWYNLYPDADGNGYGDYTFDGVVYDNVIAWVKAVAYDVIGMQYGSEDLGKLTLSEMAIYVLMTAAQGNEPLTSLDIVAGITNKDSLYYAENTPYDEAYRQRFVAALSDFLNQCNSGKLVNDLFSKLLNPLFYDENSLLKTLLNYKFDFTCEAAGLSAAELKQLAKYDEDGYLSGGMFYVLGNLLRSLYGANITLSDSNFVLGDIINGALPVVSKLLANSFSISLNGDTIVECVENLIGDYFTDSLYVGLGGIVHDIVLYFATDDQVDLADVSDPTKSLTLTPYKGYARATVSGNTTELSYISDTYADEAHNAATQSNNRLPGSLTANFDTETSTTTFTVSYYTDEDIFTSFSYREKGTSEWITVTGSHWNVFDETDRSGHYATDGVNKDNLYAKVTSGNVSIETLTAPAYIPLIDIGLLCIQHTATYYTVEKVDYNYTCRDRDNADANSVLYRNRHTVTVSGLTAGKTYEYVVNGIYYGTDGTAKVTNSLADSLGLDDFTFTTAPTSSSSFEFLAIADMQGMIQGMYDNSYSAISAINSSDDFSGYNFILNAGDMTDNGKNYYQWQYALNTMVETFANTSTFITAGNHENGTYAVSKFYNYTQPSSVTYTSYGESEQDYYSFNYGSAHFVVLDTNDADSKGLATAQYDWLKADLEATTADFVFVLMHKSMYSTGSHTNDPEVAAMRTQLAPLFAANDVDIVFGGHDHVYAEANIDGVLYVTLGTIGTKFYEYVNSNEDVAKLLDYDRTVQNTLDNQTFGYVKISNGVLTYNGYSIKDGVITAIDNEAVRHFNNVNSCDTLNVNFFTSKIGDGNAYDLEAVPYGYSIKFVANGKTYEHFGDITFNAAKTEVAVYLVNPDGKEEYAKTFTVVRENYALGVSLFTIGAVLAAAGIAAAVIISLKKKKKAATPDLNDSDVA